MHLQCCTGKKKLHCNVQLQCCTGKRPAALGTSQCLCDDAQKSIHLPHPISCLFLPYSSNEVLPWLLFISSFAHLYNFHLICFWFGHWLLLVHQLLQCWRWKTLGDTSRHYSKLHLPGRIRKEVLLSPETLGSRTLTDIEPMWDLVANLICLC